MHGDGVRDLVILLAAPSAYCAHALIPWPRLLDPGLECRMHAKFESSILECAELPSCPVTLQPTPMLSQAVAHAEVAKPHQQLPSPTNAGRRRLKSMLAARRTKRNDPEQLG